MVFKKRAIDFHTNTMQKLVMLLSFVFAINTAFCRIPVEPVVSNADPITSRVVFTRGTANVTRSASH
ncbi:hypothetical protein EBU95_05190 [bacterium]|nr:hypothetical protein [bacterium]